MMNLKIMELQHYTVSKELMLLEPRLLKGQRCTVVHERHRKYVVHASVKRVVSRVCALYGTSIQSSTILSKEITKGTKKLPIGLGTIQPLILIPTASPSNSHTQWVVFDAIQNYAPAIFNECSIQLANGETHTLNLSYHSLRTQISHAHAIDKYFRTLNFDQLNNMYAPLFYGEVALHMLLPVD
ncbi:competence protein ComK [Kurthia huakuii]|uniref:competence protein ComK n=1 Tax=Kurthia huakuii TaxID=1421019 RepID=UPI000496B723|nr:competence protein ComK [Kurthia huakuii]MBM7700763.1 competence transcription factor ComK [Kurthia huakuii]